MDPFSEQALNYKRSNMIYVWDVHSRFRTARFRNRLFAGSEILYTKLTYIWKATQVVDM